MEAHVAMVWREKRWANGGHDGMGRPMVASVRAVTE